jgi:DNA-binding transcriptional ArsR family regulator
LIQTSTLTGKPELETHERIASPSAWIWRGRVKSRWESLGFDSGTFDLFMKMKGARTRSNLLYALSNPRDRLQLAHQLGVDWKVVNYHIGLLSRCALVHEDSVLGRTRMYSLTTLGESLLRLLGEFDG